jgi:hypothetical protein
MHTSAVVTEQNDDVLDLEALDDDVQHWVDLMPEHFEREEDAYGIKGQTDEPFTAYTWPSWCSCNQLSGPDCAAYCGC